MGTSRHIKWASCHPRDKAPCLLGKAVVVSGFHLMAQEVSSYKYSNVQRGVSNPQPSSNPQSGRLATPITPTQPSTSRYLNPGVEGPGRGQGWPAGLTNGGACFSGFISDPPPASVTVITPCNMQQISAPLPAQKLLTQLCSSCVRCNDLHLVGA